MYELELRGLYRLYQWKRGRQGGGGGAGKERRPD